MHGFVKVLLMGLIKFEPGNLGIGSRSGLEWVHVPSVVRTSEPGFEMRNADLVSYKRGF